MEEGGSTPPDHRSPPLGARLIGGAAGAARAVAGVTGIDRTIEAATEEAIVRAIESEAVERAIVRVLQGPVVEDAVQGALTSPAVERAVIEALDSEMVDRVWAELLDSDEVQKLIERIADAPEIRSAIASQGLGLLDDISGQLQRATRGLDDAIERIVRAVLRKRKREERPPQAGLVTRGTAFAADLGIIDVGFIAFSALVALIWGTGQGASVAAILAGIGVWIVIGGIYLTFFWSLAGQTPGMRLLGIRIEHEGSHRLGFKTARRRVVALLLAIIPLGLGLVGIVTREKRQGFHDRVAGTEVLYGKPTIRLFAGLTDG